MQARHRSHILLALAVLLIGFVFWSQEWLQEFFYAGTGALQLASDTHPLAAAGAFVLLSGVSAMLSFFSTVPLVPAVVLIFGNEATFVLLVCGWLLGGAFTYLVGAYAGHPLVRRFAYFNRFEEWRHHLSGRTEFLFALLFQLSTPSEMGYLFGMVRYAFWKYCLVTFLAELPYALIAVYASDAFVNERRLEFVIWILAGLIVVSTALLFMRRLRKK